jgi:hypothetical protein
MSLILWSGGLDSTLALYRELVGATRGSAWNVGVGANDLDRRFAHRTLSVEWPQAAGQRWLPRSRKRIAKALRAAGLDFGEHIVTVDVDAHRTEGHPIQGGLWIAAASLLARDDEDVVLGWLRGECDNLAEVRAAFDALQRYHGKTGKLFTPLASHTKADVLVELGRAKVAGLEDASWWCEGPIKEATDGEVRVARGRAYEEAQGRYRRGEPCRLCVKCEEVATARWRVVNQRRFHDMTGATG